MHISQLVRYLIVNTGLLLHNIGMMKYRKNHFSTVVYRERITSGTLFIDKINVAANKHVPTHPLSFPSLHKTELV